MQSWYCSIVKWLCTILANESKVVLARCLFIIKFMFTLLILLRDGIYWIFFLSLPNILGVVYRGKTARRPWRCSEECIGRILVDWFFQQQCLTYHLYSCNIFSDSSYKLIVFGMWRTKCWSLLCISIRWLTCMIFVWIISVTLCLFTFPKCQFFHLRVFLYVFFFSKEKERLSVCICMCHV
jgi:hypothetical protein